LTSIRRKTSVLVAASTAGLLALGGLALYAVVHAALTSQLDDVLSSRASALQSLTRFDEDKVEMDFNGEVMPRYQAGKDAEFFVAWQRGDHGWQVLERSESLRAFAWPLAAGEPPAPGSVNVPLPDGQAGRSLTIDFVPRAEHEGADERDAAPPAVGEPSLAPIVRVLVIQSRRALDRTLRTIALSIGGVGLALVLASVAATRWAVRCGTRPLETLAARVAEIGPGTLDRRLNADDLPTELTPIAGRLNSLLARLDDAFARERRFTSAASHELRTPIAELRMLLEVGLSRERTPERWAQSARDGLGVLDRAQRLTEALLQLSRAEAGSHAALPDAMIDLAAVMREQAARALEASGRDVLHVFIDAPGPLPARIDLALAASIIGNLIDNALSHGDVSANRPARCIGASDSGETVIVISNHAPGLTDTDVAHLFEPFWRKDTARDARGGFGLGLAVSRALAASLGGQLIAVMDHEKNLRVSFRVPT